MGYLDKLAEARAKYAAEHADEMPPVKVVHIIEAHFCRNCGAMCPSCVRTDEAAPSGSTPTSQSPTSSSDVGSTDE